MDQPSPPGDDPLLSQANALVPAANAFAVGSLPQAKAEFPFMNLGANPEDAAWWTIVVTIAAVYIAATRLRNLDLGDAREGKLMAPVSNHLVELNPNALVAFDDCKEFFSRNFDALTARGHEPRFIASDSIGLWIAWNLLDRSPEVESEWGFVRAMGALVTHSFFGWWGRAH